MILVPFRCGPRGSIVALLPECPSHPPVTDENREAILHWHEALAARVNPTTIVGLVAAMSARLATPYSEPEPEPAQLALF